MLITITITLVALVILSLVGIRSIFKRLQDLHQEERTRLQDQIEFLEDFLPHGNR